MRRAPIFLPLAMAAVLATGLAGCDKDGGGGTTPKQPINAQPAQLSRGHIPIYSSWSFSVATTTTPTYGSPTTKYDIWYYRSNNTYDQDGASFQSLEMSGSSGSVITNHGETWKVGDHGMTIDFGGANEAQIAAFPMSVGKTWTSAKAYHWGHRYSTQFTCSGIDNIQTNRGYLYAFRVSFHNEKTGTIYGRTYTDTTDGTMWIAPQYGLVRASSTVVYGENGDTKVFQAEIT